jgi:hypothetical protein
MSAGTESDGRREAEVHADVCIVGAGVAGLNALWVASQYLTPQQRIVLVDRRTRAGGMWVDTYPYVRLHQPHSMFTAGDIRWDLDEPAAYLATQPEVLHHLQRCLDELKSTVEVVELWGHLYNGHHESGEDVRIECADSAGRPVTVVAQRFIKADSANVPRMPALEVSSNSVRSVSPNDVDVRTGDLGRGTDPVWIVGGGKTGMDTALALLTVNRDREINLISGGGSVFYEREQCFPSGVRRWVSGTPWNTLNAHLARRFDGTNEADVLTWFAETHGTAVTRDFDNFFLGVLSRSEADTISSGLNEVVPGYLDDVVDHGQGARLLLRDGDIRDIPAGSWVINCTGHLTQHPVAYEPYTSPSGRVLSLGGGATIIHLPSYRAYCLTHLMFLNALTTTPLYELDAGPIRSMNKAAFAMSLMTVTAYNLSLIADVVPPDVHEHAGIDLDRWFPAPRRALTRLQYALTHRRDRRHHQRTLDLLGERFGVHCAPLTPNLMVP